LIQSCIVFAMWIGNVNIVVLAFGIGHEHEERNGQVMTAADVVEDVLLQSQVAEVGSDVLPATAKRSYSHPVSLHNPISWKTRLALIDSPKRAVDGSLFISFMWGMRPEAPSIAVYAVLPMWGVRWSRSESYDRETLAYHHDLKVMTAVVLSTSFSVFRLCT
jgi:hypothetical protein